MGYAYKDLVFDIEDGLDEFEIHHVPDVSDSLIAIAIADRLISLGWVTTND